MTHTDPLDTRELRRLRAEHRYLCKIERLERKAEPLIGELLRDGATVYYINLTPLRAGRVKESTRYYELIDYLIRNKYVI